VEHTSHPVPLQDTVVRKVGVVWPDYVATTFFVEKLRLFFLLHFAFEDGSIVVLQLLDDLFILYFLLDYHFACVEVVLIELFNSPELHMLKHELEHVFPFIEVIIVLKHHIKIGVELIHRLKLGLLISHEQARGVVQ